jgi:DnaJ-class molecular chaperone
MEDYYKILNIEYNASKEQIIASYDKLMINFKIQPFISENDKTQIKLIKKAHFVLTNDEYKKTYDTNLALRQKQQQSISFQPVHTINNKKSGFNNSYIADRIFSMHCGISNNMCNVEKSELLRPKNVGLSSDVKPEIDTPLDFNNQVKTEILPFDYNDITNNF